MEFDISASALLSENISLITADSAISPANRLRTKPQTCLEDIIDALGVKSAQAQRLSSPITTWSKLRINRHRIYLLADLLANNERGIILGFIKVGQKQLFVLDHEGNHNEMHPLCVLDFYIHESQQRKGHGLQLFRHMLNKENVDPSHLAIDRPSPKFTSFLRKHFHLWATIPQVNNFVVFDGFFKNRKDRRKNSNRGSRIMFEDGFRPLSRAFSEDIIRRNRAKYPRSITDLSLVKPFSSNGSGEFNRANQWNMQRNGGTNRFSRFAVNESMHAPSFDNMRNPPQSKQSDSANMHTTRHNDHCINNEEHGQQNEESAIRLQGQGDVRKPVDQKPPLHKVISPAMQRNSNFSAEKYGSNVLENNNYVPHNSRANTSEDLFQAKVGHNSIRNFQYSKPSDMIAELKQKDREASAHSSRSQSMKFGSSWNVFGIPPRSIPHPRK